MLRTVVAIVAGYFSITALNSFVHLIVSIYFRTDVTLTGVSFLPSTSWTIGVTILQFAFGLFGGLLSTTLAKNPSKVILGLILVMASVGLINYSMTLETEPLWFLIISPILTIAGIYAGFRIQMNNTNNGE